MLWFPITLSPSPSSTNRCTPSHKAGFAMKGAKSKAETKTADNKLSVKKGAAVAKAGKKSSKKDKDPNMPKRPASAFFVFMEEFRKQYKEKHPNNKSVAVVGKAGGAKWKSMSEAEKAPYVAKAEKRKKEYETNMETYNRKQAQGTNAAEDDGSEVHDDEDDEEDGSGEEEDDD